MTGQPAEFSAAYQLGALQEAVKGYLAGYADRAFLASIYAEVRGYQRAASVSEAVREAARYEAAP